MHSLIQLGLYEFYELEEEQEYYLKELEKGNSYAYYHLAGYYDIVNYEELMIDFYRMAIKQGNVNAMYDLSKYYGRIYDYCNQGKYYRMALQHGYLPEIKKTEKIENEKKNKENEIEYKEWEGKLYMFCK